MMHGEYFMLSLDPTFVLVVAWNQKLFFCSSIFFM